MIGALSSEGSRLQSFAESIHTATGCKCGVIWHQMPCGTAK
jgi:hypothetical protein